MVPSVTGSSESLPSASKFVISVGGTGSPLHTSPMGAPGAAGRGSTPPNIAASSRTPLAPPAGNAGPPTGYMSPGSNTSLPSAGSTGAMQASEPMSTEKSISPLGTIGGGGPLRLSVISPRYDVSSSSSCGIVPGGGGLPGSSKWVSVLNAVFSGYWVPAVAAKLPL